MLCREGDMCSVQESTAEVLRFRVEDYKVEASSFRALCLVIQFPILLDWWSMVEQL